MMNKRVELDVRLNRTLSYYNECLRLYNMCAEVSLVKRAHSLFGRNAQQVVYELQVRDDGRSATGGA